MTDPIIPIVDEDTGKINIPQFWKFIDNSDFSGLFDALQKDIIEYGQTQYCDGNC